MEIQHMTPILALRGHSTSLGARDTLIGLASDHGTSFILEILSSRQCIPQRMKHLTARKAVASIQSAGVRAAVDVRYQAHRQPHRHIQHAYQKETSGAVLANIVPTVKHIGFSIAESTMSPSFQFARFAVEAASGRAETDHR
jgi:hypothetical protein